MFEKYPDQALERRQMLSAGIGFGVVGALFFFCGGGGMAFIFLLPTFIFIPVSLFCSSSGFETAKRIGSFFVGF